MLKANGDGSLPEKHFTTLTDDMHLTEKDFPMFTGEQ